jgi:hypothetical protein
VVGSRFTVVCCPNSVVEVKGTQTSGREIILTSGEVEFARRRQGQMALFVLHSIQASNWEDGFVLKGGGRQTLRRRRFRRGVAGGFAGRQRAAAGPPTTRLTPLRVSSRSRLSEPKNEGCRRQSLPAKDRLAERGVGG